MMAALKVTSARTEHGLDIKVGDFVGPTPSRVDAPRIQWLVEHEIPESRAHAWLNVHRGTAAASLPVLAAVLEVPLAQVYAAAGHPCSC
jgi:hypothetical protein